MLDLQMGIAHPIDSPCPPDLLSLLPDVDECQEGNFCHNGECTNTRGSFACVCHEGYILDSSRSSCISHHVISEVKAPCFRVLRDGRCSLPTLRNITKQICCCSRVGKAWGWACQHCPPFGSEGFKDICPAGPGYHYSASDLRFDTRFLGQDPPRVPVTHQHGRQEPSPQVPRTTAAPAFVDVDECRGSPHPCANGHCQNSPGGFSCRCRTGFQADPSGMECQDVDECAHVPRPCTGGHCLNTLGSFRCSCPSGYQPDPSGAECRDVDECKERPSLCQPGRCENLLGGYRCNCPIGYQPNPLGTLCADVDECLQSPPPCGSGRCENVPGGYRCLCPAGFRASLTENQCLDIDECAAAGLPCGPQGRCLNTEGSFRCQCAQGYRTEGVGGVSCMDVNECLEGNFCFPRGECLNTEGSYTCLCAQGFTAAPDGTSCEDIDECLTATVCAGGHCANTEGSFDCYCPPGTRSTLSKASCADIDECQEYGAALCGTQRCENSVGSYRCVVACQAGYRTSATGDCVDIDECQESRVCGEKQCENTLGSYHCVATCQIGYQATAAGDCIDVDECQNSSACGAHSICHNLLGSFQCICDQGYESARDGRHCLDVNECETLHGVCGTAPCENVEGSFLCICPQAGEEFDPMTGRCIALPGAARPPALPRHPDAVQSENGDGLRRECYYDPNTVQACEDILSRNATHQECCCSLGHGWGLDCHLQTCPSLGTGSVSSRQRIRYCPRQKYPSSHRCAHVGVWIQPNLNGAGGPHGTEWGRGLHFLPLFPTWCTYTDVDECALFSSQVCKGGVCVNKIPGYSCYCPNGYYYETQHLECIDNNECLDEEAEPCVGGHCINTIGSYYCSCTAPLVLDPSQRRCVTNESHGLDEDLAVCWQEVGPDLVCRRPRLDRRVTYTECCCLYGEAWSMNCALCPARDSECFAKLYPVGSNPHPTLLLSPDDFEALCNVLQRPSYRLGQPGSLGAPFEYGGGEFLPYGPDVYDPLAQPGPLLPSYDALPRESLYGPSPYEAAGLDDAPYSDVQLESPAEDPQGGHQPRSPSDSGWHYPSRGRGHSYPERPSRASEDYLQKGSLLVFLGLLSAGRFGGTEGLPAEECGILSGCENGQCVQVADGFTCSCNEGYRLDPTHMACRDIDECREMARLCSGGRCLNLDGSYRCLCPLGTAPAGQPPRCLHIPRSRA
ncbi:hypothetical protein Chor_001823 [Crotalus horridus]